MDEVDLRLVGKRRLESSIWGKRILCCKKCGKELKWTITHKCIGDKTKW